jgi:hypothetical protein
MSARPSFHQAGRPGAGWKARLRHSTKLLRNQEQIKGIEKRLLRTFH